MGFTRAKVGTRSDDAGGMRCGSATGRPLLLLLLLAAAAAAATAVAGAGAPGVTGEERLARLTQLAKGAGSNVISLDTKAYDALVVQQPRPYALFVLFTVASQRFRCQNCESMDEEYEILAQSYESKYGNPGAAIDGTPPVFFVRMEYQANQAIFQKYGISNPGRLPLLVHVPPYAGAKTSAEYQLDPYVKYNIPSIPEAEDVASFVHDRSGLEVPIRRSMLGVYFFLLVLFGGMIAAVWYTIDHLEYILENIIRPRKGLWVAVSLGIYTCAISGLIYDIIRKPALFYPNPHTGQLLFFYPQQGSQFVVEGFIIGFLDLGCAIFIGILALFVNRRQSSSANKVIASLSTVGFVGCFLMVRSFYQMKAPWYR